jgi:hypothetical protein
VDIGWGAFVGAVTLMLGVQRILTRLPTAAAGNNANRSVASLLLGRLARSDSATCGGSLFAAGIVTLTTLTLSRNVAVPALRGARVSSMASSSSDDAAREKELQGLWANAYDGLIDVPGEEAGVVVYTKPVATPSDPAPTPFPHIVASSRLFALTGFNPMGEDRPVGENRAANEKLVVDIQAMTPAPKAWWRAFGFAHDWREDGFVLAYDPEHGDAGEKAVVDLAVKYGQGAIYAYEPVDGRPGAVARRTVSVAMSQTVEADVVVERCDTPTGLRFAKPVLADDEY